MRMIVLVQVSCAAPCADEKTPRGIRVPNTAFIFILFCLSVFLFLLAHGEGLNR